MFLESPAWFVPYAAQSLKRERASSIPKAGRIWGEYALFCRANAPTYLTSGMKIGAESMCLSTALPQPGTYFILKLQREERGGGEGEN